MQEPNFRCPKTGEEFFIVNYSISIGKDGKPIYKNKLKDVIKNPSNGETLQLIEKHIDWNKVNVSIGTGNDKDGIAKRNSQLKKRSKEHFKKEVNEVKYQKNKDLIKSFES
jgi:hypothetical protein